MYCNKKKTNRTLHSIFTTNGENNGGVKYFNLLKCLALKEKVNFGL